MRERSLARYVLVGALAWAAGGALFGAIWTLFELPFAMAGQWALGAAALGWLLGGTRLAWREALAGGLGYAISFSLIVFLILAPLEIFLFGPPVALATGAVVGAVAAGRRGVLVVALWALAGSLFAEFAVAAVSALAPASIDRPGVAQASWFAAGQAAGGLAIGAAIGMAFGRLAAPRRNHRQK